MLVAYVDGVEAYVDREELDAADVDDDFCDDFVETDDVEEGDFWVGAAAADDAASPTVRIAPAAARIDPIRTVLLGWCRRALARDMGDLLGCERSYGAPSCWFLTQTPREPAVPTMASAADQHKDPSPRAPGAHGRAGHLAPAAGPQATSPSQIR